MPVMSLHERFDRENLNASLTWLNPPTSWRIDHLRSCLVIEPDAPTDFWQRTHYEFQAANGHLLKAEFSYNAVIRSQIRSYPVHQYDQAGLMVWFSEDCWLKTSVEFEDGGANQLGAVVTNGGFSDWSMQDFGAEHASGPLSYGLQIRRAGGDFYVEYRLHAAHSWKLIRMAHLAASPDQPCLAGLYACCPKKSGFRAEFEFLAIDLEP
jgi:regulation of enolase protein 1 (concanavalin A-like superfamily)